MDKLNFKKLALMGMAGGLLVSAQTNANESVDTNNTSEIFLAAGCNNGCGSKASRNTQYTADAERGTLDQQRTNVQRDMQKNMSQNSSKSLTESELSSQLNANGKTAYQSLDAEGKALAQKLAAGSCKGNNECKGLSACKTATNAECAGKNGCKGTGTAQFKDKNEAVKIAAKKMEEKRARVSKGY